MKILIVSQYFNPENFIINDIVRVLAEQGHEIVVATGKPNYPDGNVFPGYRAWGCQSERYLDSVDVLRVPIWPRGTGGAKNLVLNYLSFVLSGILFFPWLLRKYDFDSILVFAPSPITQVIPAIFLKWLKKAKLVVWVQDLWPESLSATGFIKNQYVLTVVGKLVRCIYSFSDRLLIQSQAFVEPISHYAPLEKVIYYPNSIDSDSLSYDSPISDELSSIFDERFCIVFAGNLGTAQALETIVQAAVLLRDMDDICFILIGSGSRLSWLHKQKKEHGLDNLILPGRFPVSHMPAIFARAATLLVSLKNEPIFAQTVPSKIQAYLAAGRPIIASLNGEGARIIEEAGAGFSCAAEQVLPLVAAVKKMHLMDTAQREMMGCSGRQYFDTNFEMKSQVNRLVDLLNR